MNQNREPFQFGQDPTTRSMTADKEMLEYLLIVLPEQHEARGAVVQDLENLNKQLQEVKENERNNSSGN